MTADTQPGMVNSGCPGSRSRHTTSPNSDRLRLIRNRTKVDFPMPFPPHTTVHTASSTHTSMSLRKQQGHHTPLNNIYIYIYIYIYACTCTHNNARHTYLPSNELGYIEHIFSLFHKRSPPPRIPCTSSTSHVQNKFLGTEIFPLVPKHGDTILTEEIPLCFINYVP